MLSSVDNGRRRDDRRGSNDFMSLTIGINNISLVARLYNTASRTFWRLLFSISLAAFNVMSLLGFRNHFASNAAAWLDAEFSCMTQFLAVGADRLS